MFTVALSPGLTTEQMLLKDMKVVSGGLSLAVSVLYVTLEVSRCSRLPARCWRRCSSPSLSLWVFQEFLQKAALEAELSGFCQKHGFDLLLLMTISFTESKEPVRELAVFSLSTACREQVRPDLRHHKPQQQDTNVR